MCIVSLRLALLGFSNVRKDMYGALPIKSSFSIFKTPCQDGHCRHACEMDDQTTQRTRQKVEACVPIELKGMRHQITWRGCTPSTEYLVDAHEWSQCHEESEWSLMTSLMRFFSAGRNGTAQDVLLRGSFGCTLHAVTV